MFHGLTPAFLSTLVIYILGILLIVTFSYWVKLLQRQPGKTNIQLLVQQKCKCYSKLL